MTDDIEGYWLAAGSDPSFTSRAELDAWVAKRAKEASSKLPTGQLAALRIIRRVVLAHAHLLGETK